MTHGISIDDLMKMPEDLALLDVRTAAEFLQGHIPSALNLPLFTNEERVQVGITYKKGGREAAILLAFDLCGPKWSGFIRQAIEKAPQKKVALHCWRGGMRSGAMAWALDLYGFHVYLLEGGYKQYRRWVLRQFEGPYHLSAVGGMTGSGKTRVLQHLNALGEQAIDLEDLAQHRGSTYGSLNQLIQPTQEQFENNLAERLRRMDRDRRIWVEDESIAIGQCLIPKSFWDRLQDAFLFDLQVPADQRVAALVQEYGSLDREFLVECTTRIRKRLGYECAQLAIIAIREGRMDDFIRAVLPYYDKTYRKALNNRVDRMMPICLDGADPAHNARKVLDVARTFSAGTHSTA